MQHSAIGIHLPQSGRGKSESNSTEMTDIRSKSESSSTAMTEASPNTPNRAHQKEVQAIVTPYSPAIKTLILEVLVCSLLFGTGWLLLHEYILPPHPFFALIVLFLLATTLAKVLDYFKVVGLLGMLVAGLIVRNGFNLKFHPDWSSYIRLIALSMILLSGGLGLKWDRVKAAGATTFLLAFMPAPCEAIAVAVVAHFTLGMPFLWAFLLGFGVAAVSPAVVVPIMIKFIKQGLGTNKRIPTIIIAASGMDDIFGVTGFTILLGYLGEAPPLALMVMKPVVEIIGGILVGLFMGYFYTAVYEFTDIYSLPFLHFFVTVITAAAMMLAGSYFHSKAAGALAVLVFGFMLSFLQVEKQEQLRKYVQRLWAKIAMPLLFSLIGEAIVFSKLDWTSVGFGVIIIIVGLLFRSAAAYTVGFNSKLDHNERLFLSLAWVPKATVQAVMASIPLDIVSDDGSDQEIKYARQILSILALSIFLTAPTAAFVIDKMGPHLLKTTDPYTNVVTVDVSESQKELVPADSPKYEGEHFV